MSEIKMKNLKELAQSIYEANKAKGFWPDNPQDRNFGEAIMLVTDELSEAHEGWRQNKRANMEEFERAWFHYGKAYFESVFREHVKDTFEDELADAVIRLLDIGYGYQYDMNVLENGFLQVEKSSSYQNANMGEWLLYIQGNVMDIYKCWRQSNLKHQTAYNIGWAVGMIVELVKHHSIDLDRHIELKLSYNALRPYKHGKAY